MSRVCRQAFPTSCCPHKILEVKEEAKQKIISEIKKKRKNVSHKIITTTTTYT